jgi:hypothetical protein
MPTVGVLTNSGKALIASRLNGAGTSPTHVGWGTGPGPAEAADAGLDTPAPEARVQGTTSIVTTDVADDTYQVDATITATGTRTITEVGVFTAATAGSIFTKVSFDGIPVEADDTIRFVLGYQTTNPA